ncbi:putative oxidoreductase C30D10.05c-like protein [Emericellopsis cladophorae]|uniref:Oxidoreductase C30D10.05c-like protein n=1 Tax=Emericellopsis cladophorae TaxID=2686198 RepID=A0A9P9Y2J5_9HYPO|nr:putative oxidoreductase C30D10.05c-like protein [Emericellopsis cladophorae]KAI6781973.1 putative oxidoreductase C30D10.05c-like protein [Emericellopsis cladophorae]
MAKTFIITGASKGIGLAVTKRLLSQSHNVVLAARSADLLEKIKAQSPKQVEYVAGDMTDETIPGKLVTLAVEKFGGVNGVVINHGVLNPKKMVDSSLEDLKRVYNVNVFSNFTMAKAALAELRKSKGCLIWVSSGASTKAYEGWGAYGSSKSSVNALSAHIAVEEPDITSLALAPGRVDTDMQAALRSEGKDTMGKAVYDDFVDAYNTGTLLKPEQPGNVIAAFVANPDNNLSGKLVKWNGEEMGAFQQ